MFLVILSNHLKQIQVVLCIPATLVWCVGFTRKVWTTCSEAGLPCIMSSSWISVAKWSRQRWGKMTEFDRSTLFGRKWAPKRSFPNGVIYTQTIHVWHIYLHLVDFYGKSRSIYHTWMVWDISPVEIISFFVGN